MEEVSRMSINPFYVVHKCGRCKRRIYYGPKCSFCRTFYHYGCAILQKTCCDVELIPKADMSTPTKCPKCRQDVEFGPQCSVCKTKFHNYCISQFEQCCQLNICELKKLSSQCGKCRNNVDWGPKCPLCKTVFHESCLGDFLECCQVKFTRDDPNSYKCRKCSRKLGLGSPMCIYCGKVTHMYCLRNAKSCCGRPIPLELYFIPNFKYLISYYMQFEKRRAVLKQLEGAVNHHHALRTTKKIESVKKSVSSQTHGLDTVTIVDVKTELEQKELEIIDEPPPHLEREDNSPEPYVEPSSSVPHVSSVDNNDTLKNLFDFLYNMVKKFPPTLQTEVKIELFKTVTEADMKWQCNMLQNNNL